MLRLSYICSDSVRMALAEPFEARSDRCATAVLVYVICAVPLVGCPQIADAPDSGAADAQLSVELRAEELSLGDDVVLSAASLGISELRARNDRGGDLEPRKEGIGALDLTSGHVVRFGAVPPATYGGVSLRLEDGSWGRAFEATLADADGTLLLTASEPLSLELRCESPSRANSETTLRLVVTFDAEELFDVVRELVADTAGQVVVDAETDPDLWAEVRVALESAWSATCSGDHESLDRDE